MQIAHAKLANESGVAPENFLSRKGDVIHYDGKDMVLNEKVNSGNILIDGIGVGDVGNIVLRDRHLLAEDGIFIAVVTLIRKIDELLLVLKFNHVALYTSVKVKN